MIITGSQLSLPCVFFSMSCFVKGLRTLVESFVPNLGAKDSIQNFGKLNINIQTSNFIGIGMSKAVFDTVILPHCFFLTDLRAILDVDFKVLYS